MTCSKGLLGGDPVSHTNTIPQERASDMKKNLCLAKIINVDANMDIPLVGTHTHTLMVH